MVTLGSKQKHSYLFRKK